MKKNYAKLNYWEYESFFKSIDIIVLGSGIVGLNAAIHIREKAPQLKVAVIERGVLPSGASTRNAGFACFGSLSELLDDMNHQSEDQVLQLLEKRWKGLEALKARLGEKAIQYQEWGGFEIFRKGEEKVYEQCVDKMDSLNQAVASIIGRKKVYQKADDKIATFGFDGVEHLIVNQAEGQIHTGAMMSALIRLARQKDISIFNGLNAKEIKPHETGVNILFENGWEINCPRILVATNGLATQLLPKLNVKPARNQVLITQPIPQLKWKGCFHYDRGYFYFRNINSRILLGGGRNLQPQAEQTDAFGTSSLIQQALMDLLNNLILPNTEIKIDHWWSGILGLGKEKGPIIQQLDPFTTVAVRLGGMGVAIGSLIGQEGADLLLEQL